MKKILVVVAMVLAGNATFAQDLDAALARASKTTEHMSSSLSLTPEQVERVRILNEGVEQKNEYIRVDNTISDEEKKNRIQMNEDQRMMVMQQLLTEEQYNKYKTEKVNASSPTIERKESIQRTRIEQK